MLEGHCMSCKWFDCDGMKEREVTEGRFGYCKRIGVGRPGGLYWYVGCEDTEIAKSERLSTIPVFGCLLYERAESMGRRSSDREGG